MKAVKLALASITLMAGSVQAEMLSEALLKCSNEQNSLQRLVCYDRVVKDMMQYEGLQQNVSRAAPVVVPMQQAPVQAPVQAAVPAPRQTAPATVAPTQVQTAEQRFGSEGLKVEEKADEELDKIFSVVANVQKSARKYNIVTLENGQVWRQVESGSFKVKEGEQVYVERGMLGAFFMGKEGRNKRMKVKRSK